MLILTCVNLNGDKAIKMSFSKFSLAVFVFFWGISGVLAKVDPPNYDFSLDQFNQFFPAKKQVDILKAFPNSKLLFQTKQGQTYKVYIKHQRYKFPVLVQFQAGVVTDFYAKLPSYFLHNIFHQSLINRIGKQDIYKKKEEQAVYIWKNKDNNKHICGAGCTITCFPIYYTVIKNNLDSDFKTIIKQLSTQRQD